MKKMNVKNTKFKEIESKKNLQNINGGFSWRDVFPNSSNSVASTSSNKDKK